VRDDLLPKDPGKVIRHPADPLLGQGPRYGHLHMRSTEVLVEEILILPVHGPEKPLATLVDHEEEEVQHRRRDLPDQCLPKHPLLPLPVDPGSLEEEPELGRLLDQPRDSLERQSELLLPCVPHAELEECGCVVPRDDLTSHDQASAAGRSSSRK
jgi:hypothetical protein